jgi:hypothetical protein
MSSTNCYNFYDITHGEQVAPVRLYNTKAILSGHPLIEEHIPITYSNVSCIDHPVIFASSGEKAADNNFTNLKLSVKDAIRIEGCSTRWDMFQSCAVLSRDFSHFFLVTGKNLILDTSVFHYVPEMLEPNTHTIFNAINNANYLCYGHMGIGCYSRKAVEQTPKNFGLDFTMYSEVKSSPIVGSISFFAETPYEAWRTAFREAVKLTVSPDKNSPERLHTWLTVAHGEYAKFVLSGAKEGHEFAKFRTLKDLMVTESWDWLSEKFHSTSS